jgi:AraC family transcriptional regulator
VSAKPAEKSRLAFKRRDTGKQEEVLSHARIHATSKTFGWTGLYAEVGENDGWQVDNLVPAGHYIAFSRDTQDFAFKALHQGQWQDVVIAPKHLWIQPAGEPFSFRVDTTARWCGVLVDPARMSALAGDAGSQPAVEPAIGLYDPVLIPLMEAICAEVLRGGTSGQRFADAMIGAIATQLTRLFGQAQRAHKGGITGRMLRLITDHVDTQLASDITVEQLAAIAQLSEAHFSRAFKQATGQSPHSFVMARRLDRARRMLADTQDALASIAHECGFSDQAHFSRQFNQAFGVSPSQFRRSFSP